MTQGGISVELEKITSDELEFKETLGRGGFGVIQLADHKERRCCYAVKQLIYPTAIMVDSDK